jgi:hypothetical protein
MLLRDCQGRLPKHQLRGRRVFRPHHGGRRLADLMQPKLLGRQNARRCHNWAENECYHPALSAEFWCFMDSKRMRAF